MKKTIEEFTVNFSNVADLRTVLADIPDDAILIETEVMREIRYYGGPPVIDMKALFRREVTNV